MSLTRGFPQQASQQFREFSNQAAIEANMSSQPSINWGALGTLNREANKSPRGPTYITHIATMMRLKETENENKARVVLGTQRTGGIASQAQQTQASIETGGHQVEMRSVRSGSDGGTSSDAAK